LVEVGMSEQMRERLPWMQVSDHWLRHAEFPPTE